MAAVGRYRYLFSQLVRRELRRKYKGSSLGVLWYLINPLVLMGIYTLLFGHLFRLQHFADFPIFLMIGLMAWTFFSQSPLAAVGDPELRAELGARGERRLAHYDHAAVAARLRRQLERLSEHPSSR